MEELHNESELQYYLSLKPLKKWHHTKFNFVCSRCGKLSTRRLDSIKYPFLCKSCAQVIRYRDNPEIIKKIINTNKERYGGIGFASDKGRAVLNKIISDYGGIGFSSSSCAEKYKITMNERYGCDYPLQSDELYNKFESSMNEKYGVSHPLRSSELKNKAKSTYIEHHGAIGFASKEIVEKYKHTCENKYGIGVDASKTFSANLHNRRKYIFDNIIFDSSWELAYFVWLKDNNKSFIYHPNKAFEYVIGNTKHSYRPDFFVDGVYIEIKGHHLINNNGVLIDPFNNNSELVEKTQCLNDNNVVIITDCNVYIKYVLTNYGKDFFKKCRVKE